MIRLSKIALPVSTFILLYYCYLNSVRKIMIPMSKVIIPIMLMMITLMVIYSAQGKIKIVRQNTGALFVGWVLIGINIFISSKGFLQQFIYGGIIQLYVMICFLIFSVQKTEWIATWLKWTKIFVLIHAVATIIFYFNGEWYARFIGLIFEPSEYATMIKYYQKGYMSGLCTHFSSNGMILGIGVIFFFEENRRILHNKELRKKNKMGMIIYFLMVLYALILSSKRSPFLAALVAIGITYLLQDNKHILKNISILIISGISSIMLYQVLIKYVPGLSTIMNKFTELEGTDAGILNGRTGLWELAVNMFKESPILGNGYGSYAIYSKQMGAITTSAHNYYLQVAAELGLMGLVLYVIVFMSAAILTLKLLMELNRHKEDVSLEDYMMVCIALEVQIFVLIYNITATAMIYYYILIPYFLACSTACCIQYKYDDTKNNFKERYMREDEDRYTNFCKHN